MFLPEDINMTNIAKLFNAGQEQLASVEQFPSVSG